MNIGVKSRIPWLVPLPRLTVRVAGDQPTNSWFAGGVGVPQINIGLMVTSWLGTPALDQKLVALVSVRRSVAEVMTLTGPIRVTVPTFVPD